MDFLIHTEAGHLALYFVFMALVSGMPAPTAESSTAYKWVFGSLNALSANVARIAPPRVEKSPNWQPAVEAQIKKTTNGGNGH